MRNLEDTLRRRFPLLTSLRLFHGPNQGEDLAAFMGVLLAAMEQSQKSSFCFVFPQKTGIAPLSATLYALGKFAVDFPKLAENYARSGFKLGQRVMLVPEEKVFVFGGVWPGLSEWFRLKLLDDKRNTAFNWATSEVLRIKPTDRKIPKGREEDIDKARRKPPLSTLDKLIGTRTFGNPSLAANYVLYLGSRAEMENFLATTSLSVTTNGVHSTLDHLVAPGIVSESGEIRHQDIYQAAGQPLLAISSRIEHVAAACMAAQPRTKVVVIDGARKITDLSKFDLIAGSQNLIIVAEGDEEEKLQQLHNRGCRFWRFSLADIDLGAPNHHEGRFFDPVFRSAWNERAFHTEVIDCSNSHLEQVATALEKCRESLEESEADQTHLILRDLYRLLVQCAGLLAPPDVTEKARLLEKAKQLSAAAHERLLWLPELVAESLKNAAKATISAIEDPQLGLTKGNALRELLSDIRLSRRDKLGVQISEAIKELMDDLPRREVRPIALVARSASGRLILNRWLEREGLACPVLLSSKSADDGFFERLICTVWPGSERFSNVVQRFAAPRLSLLAYPFETRWLQGFNQKQRNRQVVPSVTSSEKSSLLGLSDDTTWPSGPQLPLVPSGFVGGTGHSKFDLEELITRRVLPEVLGIEETTPARIVSFSGDAYAFLTETFRIPVISALVAGTAGENYKIPRRRIADIQPGDVLVFRESGRKDVIQALADAELGADAPAIRECAARWHRALRQSGLNEATLMTELEAVNCPRSLQTVRGWLLDDSKIGPQSKRDLEAIAYAVGDQQLLDEVKSVWHAIHVLRGEHLRAGMRLSQILLEKLPERLADIEEGRTRIEIDNATSAWVVQVEHIAEREELRQRSYVNALLWDTDELF